MIQRRGMHAHVLVMVYSADWKFRYDAPHKPGYLGEIPNDARQLCGRLLSRDDAPPLLSTRGPTE